MRIDASPPSELEKRLQGYGLTTAEILYRIPDHPVLLQSYIWQELDIAPRFPVLRKFLKFWEISLEGRLYQVKIAHSALVKPAELTFCRDEFLLN